MPQFLPELAQKDGLTAGFESFQAIDSGKTKVSQDEAGDWATGEAARGAKTCLKMKPGWKQASKQLEVGFEAGPDGLGYRN